MSSIFLTMTLLVLIVGQASASSGCGLYPSKIPQNQIREYRRSVLRAYDELYALKIETADKLFEMYDVLGKRPFLGEIGGKMHDYITNSINDRILQADIIALLKDTKISTSRRPFENFNKYLGPSIIFVNSTEKCSPNEIKEVFDKTRSELELKMSKVRKGWLNMKTFDLLSAYYNSIRYQEATLLHQIAYFDNWYPHRNYGRLWFDQYTIRNLEGDLARYGY